MELGRLGSNMDFVALHVGVELNKGSEHVITPFRRMAAAFVQELTKKLPNVILAIASVSICRQYDTLFF